MIFASSARGFMVQSLCSSRVSPSMRRRIGSCSSAFKGPSDNIPILLNGEAASAPIELKQDIRYRFRFINITPHDPLLTVSLLAGSSPVTRRAVAKDGANLPISQATERPARQLFPWVKRMISRSNHRQRLNCGSKFFVRPGPPWANHRLRFRCMFTRLVVSIRLAKSQCR